MADRSNRGLGDVTADAPSPPNPRLSVCIPLLECPLLGSAERPLLAETGPTASDPKRTFARGDFQHEPIVEARGTPAIQAVGHFATNA